jgi:hypothetical protein
MDIYFEGSFESFCGTHAHLQQYKTFYYFQCWGGGPEGGFIMNDNDETFRVNRTSGEPFTVEAVDGMIDIDLHGDQVRLRIVPKN